MPRVCFYGDDLTGSTDALANFARFGLSVRLVFDATAARRVAGEVDVVGVAGTARSLPTPALEHELAPVFETFAELAPQLVQYKICSTFDSSLERGSIGRACELGRACFGAGAIPVLAAQPDLGRWTIFSNHFARAFDGAVYRLDRHPTMSRHPVTPMGEADLRVVLRSQGGLAVAALHLGELGELGDAVGRHDGPLVIDALDNDHLRLVGARLVELVPPGGICFCVGSGGLSYALASAYGGGELDTTPPFETGPVLVVSGSCSPDTARQIDAAGDAGWTALDLFADTTTNVTSRACKELSAGRSVVVHSALGAPDAGRDGSSIGGRLGDLALATLTESRARRLVVAGGDTAGAVMRVLGGDGLDYAGSFGAGPIGGSLAVCTLRSPDGPLDGLQVILKGGQLGGLTFFEDLRLAGAGA
ncbi:MAG TPA: four-carbon acid sugar kinase family protein [Acidimicrobiales bacterium]|nr:four-carbon acid sugar kinase family protein [Acidimicrobiales bacterium]